VFVLTVYQYLCPRNLIFLLVKNKGMLLHPCDRNTIRNKSKQEVHISRPAGTITSAIYGLDYDDTFATCDHLAKMRRERTLNFTVISKQRSKPFADEISRVYQRKLPTRNVHPGFSCGKPKTLFVVSEGFGISYHINHVVPFIS
jgi:hypothetical protein